MSDTELLHAVNRVIVALGTRPDLFEIVPVACDPPVSTAELDAVERELGFELPRMLREHYLEVGATLDFQWGLRDGAFRELGYAHGSGDEEDEENEGGYGDPPRGLFRIVSPARLSRHLQHGVVQVFVNDGGGDGYALRAAAGVGERPLVWFEHDIPGAARRAAFASISECVESLVRRGFATDGEPEGIETFLARFHGAAPPQSSRR